MICTFDGENRSTILPLISKTAPSTYDLFVIYRRNIIKINPTQKRRNEHYVVLAIYHPHLEENDVMKGMKKVGKIMTWGEVFTFSVE